MTARAVVGRRFPTSGMLVSASRPVVQRRGDIRPSAVERVRVPMRVRAGNSSQPVDSRFTRAPDEGRTTLHLIQCQEVAL